MGLRPRRASAYLRWLLAIAVAFLFLPLEGDGRASASEDSKKKKKKKKKAKKSKKKAKKSKGKKSAKKKPKKKSKKKTARAKKKKKGAKAKPKPEPTEEFLDEEDSEDAETADVTPDTGTPDTGTPDTGTPGTTTAATTAKTKGGKGGKAPATATESHTAIGATSTSTSISTSTDSTVLPPPVDTEPETTTAPVAEQTSTTELVGNHEGKPVYRRQIRAVRRKGPIDVDGRFDDKAWEAAPLQKMNWQMAPDTGAAAMGDTEFRVVYDDEAIFVAVHARDPQPDRIGSVLGRQDDSSKLNQSDWVAVLLDPTRNRRNAVAFQANPAGVKIDWLIADDNGFDPSYDAVWDVKTARDETGWYAEYRIPLSQLRMNDGAQDRWGFQIHRRYARSGEHDFWSPAPGPFGQRWVSVMGDTVIDDTLTVGRAIEVLPYVLGGVRIERVRENDLRGDLTPEYGVGADFKMNLTKSLKLSGALNPDFGQVEADPAEVNLTSRETFFSEKRPLFIKDSELFAFPIGVSGENMFYSRRIGAPPYRSAGDLVMGRSIVDEPERTTIYGAGKLSGQLPGGTTMGLLSVVSAEEEGKAQNIDTGEVTTAVIQPMTAYNVAQLGNNFRDGQSDLRVAGTAVNRSLDGTGIDTLHKQAYAGGAQYLHRVGGYGVLTQFASSYVEGDPAALAITQTNPPYAEPRSQRFFQRPDARHVEFDPNRTHLSGYAFHGEGKKMDGEWLGAVGVTGRSPGFETNDLGFQVDSDLLQYFAGVRHDKWYETGPVQRLNGGVQLGTFSDFAPDILRHQIVADVGWTFREDNELAATSAYTRDVLDTKLLRGGPAVAGTDAISGSLSYTTDPKVDVRATPSVSATVKPASSSWLASGGIAFNWNIRSNLEVVFEPTYQRNIDDLQYIGEVMDGAGETHYVLGHLEQSTVYSATRLNYTVSPTMSLQLFAFPIISAARFSEFKEPADPRATSYDARYRNFDQVNRDMGGVSIDSNGDGADDLGFGDPNFKFMSLSSNVVARWEYRPGSTLFAVWSQSRGSFNFDQEGRLVSGDANTLFRNKGEQIFLVKLSYWWNP